MRFALLVIFGACTFSPGAVIMDASHDTSGPDVAVTWAVDPTSGKSCPANLAEWTNFIAAHNLAISAPGGVWLLQEIAGMAVDSIGPVKLFPNSAPKYQQVVPGWNRRALGTADADPNSRLYNLADLTLPDLGTMSMTVLMIYATAATPSAARNVLFVGSGSPTKYAQVLVDSSNHLRLTVDSSSGSSSMTGTVDNGTSVVPIIMQLDRTNSQQRIITDRETITAPVYGSLTASARGILIGSSGSAAAPEGRWLYVTAWYGSAAEMTETNLQQLITALGW